MKICSKCKKEKDKDNFSKNTSQKDGLQRYCKLCKSQNYQNRKDKKLKYQKLYNSLPEVKSKRELWNKKYYSQNIEKNKEYNKNWREKNRDKCNKYNRESHQRKYNNDINYKLSEVIRSRFWNAINNNSKKSSIIILTGCSIKELKLYLENQFKPEMNWNNWGKVWEIDHILPCSSFDLTKLEEQKKCFHFNNLQPLFKTTQIAESFGYNNEIGNRNK